MSKQRLTYEQAMQAAIQFLQQGQLAQAQDYCLKITQLASDQAEAWHLLGIVEYQSGHWQAAADAYQRVIDIQPDNADAYSNLAMALQMQNRLDDAIDAYYQAVRIDSENVEAFYDLAVCLQTQNRTNEAIEAYHKALELRPDDAPTYNNLGVCLQAQNRFEEARKAFEQAIELQPDYAKAYNNYGVFLHAQKSMDEAIEAYSKAIELAPNETDAYCNLCNAYHDGLEEEKAFDVICKALQIHESFEIKALFIRCLKALTAKGFPLPGPLPEGEGDSMYPLCGLLSVDMLEALLIRALSEAWVRPDGLTGLFIRLIRCNPRIAIHIARLNSADTRLGSADFAEIGRNRLLRCLMVNAAITDIGLEHLLTLARSALLNSALDHETLDADVLEFYGALAQQCFINEYAFGYGEAEATLVTGLQQKMIVALEHNEPIAPVWLIALAAYIPLWSVPGLEFLLNRPWPEVVKGLLNQQVYEPLSEWQFRAEMPVLTEIEDEVSQRVQKQYEENPFPRWIKAPLGGKRIGLHAYIHQQFPHLKFDEAKGAGCDVLIAGCGSGQNPINTAQIFSQSQVLAVDLSLASLCYAKRKTLELGIENIEYAQADLLKLEDLGRQFDLIESMGVLHHLAEPFQGLKVLNALLRPGGFMRLGLYSDLARRDITQARDYIAENDLKPTPEDIRKFRQIVMSGTDEGLKPVMGYGDFYSISSCRDLLFHAEEHCLNLLEIEAMLDELGLRFIGFCDSDIRSGYQKRFPEDEAQTDLKSWHRFEVEYPHTFASMYQFWVFKP